MLRNLLGVRLKDKTSIGEIYLKTRAKQVGVIARTLKFKYAGHLYREDNQKWNKVLTSWVPHQGKRRRGRPKTRWSDELRRELGKSWERKTKNRQDWKSLVHTYAQKWAAEGATTGVHLPDDQGRATDATPSVENK